MFESRTLGKGNRTAVVPGHSCPETGLVLGLSRPIVVVGVGDLGRGDDGVGPMIVQLLHEAGFQEAVDSGVSPELDTWKIRELAPRTVLFVDAVDFGGSPGQAAMLKPADLRPEGFDTHRAPLRLTMEYLEREIGCACFLLAIQPTDVRPGSPMSDEVRESAILLSQILSEEALSPIGGSERS